MLDDPALDASVPSEVTCDDGCDETSDRSGSLLVDGGADDCAPLELTTDESWLVEIGSDDEGLAEDSPLED